MPARLSTKTPEPSRKLAKNNTDQDAAGAEAKARSPEPPSPAPPAASQQAPPAASQPASNPPEKAPQEQAQTASGSTDRPPAQSGGRSRLRGAAAASASSTRQTDEKVNIADVPASMRPLIGMICRKTLQLSSNMRTTLGILTYTLLGSNVADTPIIVGVQDTMKQYIEATKSKPGHGLGPPAVHVWGSILDGLLLQMSPASPTLAGIKDLRDTWESVPTDEAAQLIREARVRLAYKREDRKIVLATSPDPQAQLALKLVITALGEVGWRLLQGAAPRDGLDRLIESALEKGGKSGGRKD